MIVAVAAAPPLINERRLTPLRVFFVLSDFAVIDSPLFYFKCGIILFLGNLNLGELRRVAVLGLRIAKI